MENTGQMDVVTVKLPDSHVDHLDKLADEHDTTRAAILRSVIDNGLRAPKYYPDEFPILPENHEMADAVELAKRGKLPR